MNTLLLVLLVLSGGGGAGWCSALEDTVRHGEDLSLHLADSLVLTLSSVEGHPDGWLLSVHPEGHPCMDYATVVTPPYRGPRPLQVFAWHFLDAGGRYPNDGSVNAPGMTRELSFVTCEEDRRTAEEALYGMLWPEDPLSAEAAARVHAELPRGTAVLTITSMEMEGAGDSARIAEMSFEVEVTGPAAGS